MPEENFHGYTPIASGNQIYLERPRINHLLEKAVQYPVVTVVAGAGYGKTYAVYSFVRKYNIRTAWIQCSERDNVGERFWENYISAISIISEKTARKLRELEFPATEQQFDHYLKIPRDDVIPNEKYVFVYDDLHLITDRTVLRFLEHSITSSFPNISSILISRTEAAINPAKLSSKKLLARITEEDLRFRQNEMISYFTYENITPSPQMASVIYHDTEGWAFAIRLASLSLRNISAGSTYAPQALRSNTFKLIESEVMAGLSPQLRRFLIKLSLMENHKPALLREIEKDRAILKEMEGVVSFIRYDSYLDSYHIHHLLMDYLRERQDELSGEEKRDVWTKTALWCAANNLRMDAIINYEKTGDYHGIIKILNTLPMLLPVQMARFIFDIMERAPKEIFRRGNPTSDSGGGGFRDQAEIVEMRSRILSSLGLFEQSSKETLSSLIEFKAMEESPEKHRFLRSAYITLGFCGLIWAIHTRRYDFIDYFKKAGMESRKAGYTIQAPLNGISLSSYACRVSAPAPAEDIEKYINVIAEIVPYSTEAMGGCMSGMHELCLGEYAFFRGESEKAEEYLLLSRLKARENQQYEIENRALFYLLRISLSRGDIREINTILEQLKAELENPLYPGRYFYHDIVTGWYYIQTGRKETIAPWLKSVYEESELNSVSQGLEKLVKAKYNFSKKRYPAALAAIENRSAAEPILFGDIEMKVLEAVCRYRQADRRGAFKALEEAYSLAAPAGLFMPFTELGKDMRALAEAARKDKAIGDDAPELPPEWLDEICRNASVYAKKLYHQTAHGGKGKGALLSHRETDVLTGLSQGLTREEIAGTASISPNTVKSVTRRIYNKLGALNKADAVRIAAEKGIL